MVQSKGFTNQWLSYFAVASRTLDKRCGSTHVLQEAMLTPEFVQTVTRTAAIFHSITEIKGMFYTLFQGHMLFDEQQREVLVQADADLTYRQNVPDPDTSIGPKNLVPDMQSRLLFNGSGETLWARHEIFARGNFLTVARPRDISRGLYRLMVAKPCGHPYDTPFEYVPIQHRNGIVTLCSGLYTEFVDFRISLQNFDIPIYYQQAHSNNLAQWLSCQLGRVKNKEVSFVLQQDACIACVFKRLAQSYEGHFHTKERREGGVVYGKGSFCAYKYCIIAGRI